MDILKYLSRIAYTGPTDPTVDTLREIHRTHMFHVPFENLDIHLKRKIVLDPDLLYRKIVERRRGGFCYELNGLFAHLLRSLGYNVTMLSAGVARQAGGFGPDFDHMTLLVQLEEPWLVDVGFGESFVEPLQFNTQDEQHQDGKSYRLIPTDDAHFIYQWFDQEKWTDQYRFSLQPRQFSDYEAMCEYHQTSPESSFTQKRVCSRAFPGGRITVSNMKLIRTTSTGRSETELHNEAEVASALWEHFGVRL